MDDTSILQRVLLNADDAPNPARVNLFADDAPNPARVNLFVGDAPNPAEFYSMRTTLRDCQSLESLSIKLTAKVSNFSKRKNYNT